MICTLNVKSDLYDTDLFVWEGYVFLFSLLIYIFIILSCLFFFPPYLLLLWNRVAILAFHLAMFSNPQHPIVVLTFASLLHHRTLEESITFARQNALATKIDTPEIVGVQDDLLDDNDIAGRVTQFVEQVKSSVNALVKENCLLESMTRFPKFPCSSLVSISRYFNLIGCHVRCLLHLGVTISIILKIVYELYVFFIIIEYHASKEVLSFPVFMPFSSGR